MYLCILNAKRLQGDSLLFTHDLVAAYWLVHRSKCIEESLFDKSASWINVRIYREIQLCGDILQALVRLQSAILILIMFVILESYESLGPVKHEVRTAGTL